MTTPTSYYILQRITGMMLVPLSIWILLWIIPASSPLFLGSLQQHTQAMQIIFGDLLKVVGLIAFTICSLYHGFIGIKSVINDYIRCANLKKITIACFMCITFLAIISSTVFIFNIYIQLK